MSAMTATLVAGSELTVIGATRLGARRYRGIVADIHTDRIVLDAGYEDVFPSSGSAVSFLYEGRLFDCAVVRGAGSTLTISRPDDLAVDDRRTSRRVATSLPASLRLANLAGDVHAAQVVDLSLGGVRLLAEAGSFAEGDEVDLRMGRIACRGIVRHVLAHEHDRLCHLGIQFAPLAETDRRHLLDTVGSLRAGMHRWR